MSTADHLPGGAIASLVLLRQAFLRLLTWIAVLGRPARVRLLHSEGLTSGTESLGWQAIVTIMGRQYRLHVLPIQAIIAAVAALMVLTDAPAFALQRRLPDAVVDAFATITDFGKSGWFLWPLGLSIAAAAVVASRLDTMTNRVLASIAVRLGFLFVAIGLPGLVATIVKRLIGRVRPSDLGPFAYVPWSWRPDYASMPSGHATTAFAAAVAIGAVWPNCRIPLWIYAAVIALSRVIVAAHYPSDVFAGAMVGAFGAILVRNWWARRGLGFTLAADGTVRTMPGPSRQRLKMVARRIAGY